ncbi:MAG TPA: tetratricopeptide repeat protein [Chitinophagales bacterium]|nr:tetratricopeptide repeat protein [Chitinophagales bacterium]
MTKDECITLVKKMEELEDQEKLTRPPRAVPLQRRLEMCTENADRHFVVAMLQLRYAQGFIDIMRGEVQRIPTDEGKLAYRMVCFCGAALGLRLPESVLGNILNASIAQVQEVLYITDGLIVPHKDNTLSARHALIGREVFNLQYSYNNDPSKRPPLGALKTILISLGNERTDVCQFIDAFLSNLKIHRRVKKLLGTRTDQADAVLEAFKCYFGFFDDDLFVRFYIFQGLLYRTLGRPNDALAAFQKVGGDFGRKVGFVYRQMAYVEQEKGNFPAAAMCAIQSYDYSPKKAWHAFQVARILTLNLVRYFLYAKKYYGIAINKSGGTPEYEKYEREYNRYGEAREQQIRLTIGLDKDGFVSKEAIALLRPGLKIFKLDPGSAEFQHKLLPTFQEEDDSAIEETLEEFDPKSNTIVKAKDYTKFGRFLYDEWRRDRSSVDANEILKAYLRSIELNPNNPFTHTSLGTFYKEVERFDDAYEAYEKAYLLSKNSADPNDKHPMYATNLALLIMDLVQKEVYTKERLLYARNLLDGACKLNDKLGLKFDWAEKNRQACLVLIDRFQPRM